MDVEPDSKAETKGILKGDTIIEVGQKPVRTQSSFRVN